MGSDLATWQSPWGICVYDGRELTSPAIRFEKLLKALPYWGLRGFFTLKLGHGTTF